MHARLRLVEVGLARDVDDGEHRDQGNDSEHEPDPFADGAPVIEQVDFVFSVRVDAVVVRLRRIYGSVERGNLGLSLDEFASCFHVSFPVILIGLSQALRDDSDGQLAHAGHHALDQTAKEAFSG